MSKSKTRVDSSEGGGKSLCYQVPALCFKELDRQQYIRQGRGESGITLVVSPLIALMKDQVDALRKRGISAAQLDSSKSKEEYLQIVDSMRDGTLDILYCAPERLNNEGFVNSMVCIHVSRRSFDFAIELGRRWTGPLSHVCC